MEGVKVVTERRHGSANTLRRDLTRRILVLDGAMGTMIQRLCLAEADFRGDRYAEHARDLKGNNEILCLTRPDAIERIHRAYLEAGADIISTNTLNGSSISQAYYGTDGDAHEINLAAARLAKAAAAEFSLRDSSRPRFVAGVLGPTSKTCSLSPDVNSPGYREITFDQMVSAYREQAAGLLDGGVDILMVETVFDTLNAKAALFAIRDVLDARGLDVPTWVSATVDAGGRMLTGQTVEAFWTSVSHAGPLCVGLNCSLGAEAIRPHLAELARAADTFVSVHPNAGLPNELGEYDESPEHMAATLREFAGSGLVNIVGGCCGSTPEHIAVLARAIEGVAPRRIPILPPYSRLSGLEQLEIRPDSLFVNVGERTNITGSARFAGLIRDGRHEDALEVARDQIRAGAQIIDVNVDDPLLDSIAEMTNFLNMAASDPEVNRVPVMIDSAAWDVLEAGLKCLLGKGVVNSISLKDGEEEFIRRARLIRRYGAAVVVMAFDEAGQAEDYRRRVDICTRAYTILTSKVGFPPQDIVFDPNVFAIGTGISGHNDYAVAFIEACRTLKETLPHCLVSGGVSNLSYAFRGNNAIRRAMHSVFLYHAISAGMDMGIVNAGQLAVYEEIPEELRRAIEDLVLNRRSDALKRVMELAQLAEKGEAESKTAGQDLSWRQGSPAQRLEYALVNGVADYVEGDALAALDEMGEPMQVIEGPLMAGMSAVGDLFGAGKMFLPQVVRSARVMKKAVMALEPYLADAAVAGGPAATSRPKVLLATVKGDVHDIGKNIVGLVLGCNGYQVIDLGVMVSAEDIVRAAEREAPDVIGLSGLITPSLEQMAFVAGELDRRGFATPLLVGGATTSRAHTALKIDPAYRGPVIHVSDASRAVTVVASLVGGKEREGAARDTKSEYARLRAELLERRAAAKVLPLAEARRRKLTIHWGSFRPKRPRDLGVTAFDDYPVAELWPYVQWTPLLRLWKLSGRYPDVLRNERFGEEARKLLAEAEALLRRIIDEKLLRARAVLGLFAANSVGDDIEIYADDERSSLLAVIHCLRQQAESAPGGFNLSLSDFVAPKETGVADYLGAFVVSAGFGAAKLAADFKAAGDDFSAIMARALADRLAEALAERVHLRVRREFWGYAADENLGIEELAAEKYIGVRPAPGYPACPDHTEKGTLFELLAVEENTGVRLTETFAMDPAASVGGWFFAHPESRYFSVGKIDQDQLVDYARRKGMSVAEAEHWLAPNLVLGRGAERTTGDDAVGDKHPQEP
jgi:5-methyltetrahydrofolate--homocysteine methyltransferase